MEQKLVSENRVGERASERAKEKLVSEWASERKIGERASERKKNWWASERAILMSVPTSALQFIECFLQMHSPKIIHTQ